MKVKIIFEGRVPLATRIRDRIAVKLLFAGHRNAARRLLLATGVNANPPTEGCWMCRLNLPHRVPGQCGQ